MEDFEGLPDERLARFAHSYFWYEKPIAELATVLANVIAFSHGDTQVRVEGELLPGGMTFCAVHEPAVVSYSKGPGALFAIRLLPGALDRLFHIDPREGRGVTVVRDSDVDLKTLRDALRRAPQEAAAQFAAADRALVDLLPQAKPRNVADRYIDLLVQNDPAGDLVEIASRLGCSLRTLERACAARFARSPKRILRGIRAAHTFNLEQRTGERPETMAQFAYADLAHYANDLRKITGRSRTQHSRETRREKERQVTRLWPDGTIARTAEDRRHWEEEQDRRYRR